MHSPASSAAASRISYACYDHCRRTGKQLGPYHVFSYQLAGQSRVSGGQQTQLFRGWLLLPASAQPAAHVHEAAPGRRGQLRTLAVCLGKPLLRALSQEYDYPVGHSLPTPAILPLASHALFQSCFESLRPYEQLVSLLTLKVREAALVQPQDSQLITWGSTLRIRSIKLCSWLFCLYSHPY